MQSMSPATQRPRKTIEDYLALPDDVRAELIDGELYMPPAPRRPHQRAAVRLVRLLEAHVEERSGGLVFVAPFDVHLPSGDVVQPDVLFVAAGRAEIVPDWVRGVPDLVIEVLSPTHGLRDRIVKKDLYARNGVPEYWIVDPEERTIEVFLHEEGTYRPAGYFTAESTLATPTFPDLRLRLADVFE